MRYYVNLFDGKGGKLEQGFDCKNPIDGLRRLPISGDKFIFASAACFSWEPDKLPERHWFLEIEK